MELRQRKKMCLRSHNYGGTGYYFITICVKGRWPILCSDVQCVPQTNRMPLSEVGEVVKIGIEQIPTHYSNVQVDKYIIMPNHIHAVLITGAESGRTMCAPTSTPSLLIIVRMLKEYVTKSLGYSIWQKSFYDHIVRDESDYLRICEYIETNPAKWQEDIYYAVPKGEMML